MPVCLCRRKECDETAIAKTCGPQQLGPSATVHVLGACLAERPAFQPPESEPSELHKGAWLVTEHRPQGGLRGILGR